MQEVDLRLEFGMDKRIDRRMLESRTCAMGMTVLMGGSACAEFQRNDCRGTRKGSRDLTIVSTNAVSTASALVACWKKAPSTKNGPRPTVGKTNCLNSFTSGDGSWNESARNPFGVTDSRGRCRYSRVLHAHGFGHEGR